jgi:hypothetical protein
VSGSDLAEDYSTHLYGIQENPLIENQHDDIMLELGFSETPPCNLASRVPQLNIILKQIPERPEPKIGM